MRKSNVNSTFVEGESELVQLIAAHFDIKQKIVQLLLENFDVTHATIQDLDANLTQTFERIMSMPLETDDDRLQRMKFVTEEIHEICENGALARRYTESLIFDANMLAK